MIPSLKAEFRKLLTIRTSYVIPAAAYALLVFVQFYIQGYHNGPAVAVVPGKALFFADSITQTSAILSILGAVVALLLFTHEYRYNLITYTLTAVNSRSKVLISKIIAVAVYIAVFVLIGDAVALGSLVLGLHFAGVTVPSQDISYLNYFAQTLGFCEGWALAGSLFAVLLRNQVATIAVLFIVPNTVESLLTLLLKDNSKYLPFTALAQAIAPPNVEHGLGHRLVQTTTSWSPPQAILLFGAYLAAAWVVAWVLFLKRDAN